MQLLVPAMQKHVTVLAVEDALHTQFKSCLCVCSAAAALAKKLNVECPIIDGIFRVIHDNAEPLEVSLCMSSDVECCLAAIWQWYQRLYMHWPSGHLTVSTC